MRLMTEQWRRWRRGHGSGVDGEEKILELEEDEEEIMGFLFSNIDYEEELIEGICHCENHLLFLSVMERYLSSVGIDLDEEEKVFLQSDTENNRREKFEALLKLQQENNGLIEPRKNLAIQPGMFLPEHIAKPSTSMDTDEEQCENGASDAILEVNSGHPNKATTSKQHRNPDSRRKNRFHSSRGPPQAPPRWIRKGL